jgi:hypothetical protein
MGTSIMMIKMPFKYYQVTITNKEENLKDPIAGSIASPECTGLDCSVHE